tara:strand:- start:36 stop:779 length:744 start_codon:yes stop_codon:yes gene_type:complete
MIFGVPGVNGLGKTNGLENSPKVVLNDSAGKILDLDLENIENQQKEIFSFFYNLDFKEREFFIGGDHSISYPLTKIFFNKFPEGKLIVFDAHPDLMPALKEPTHEEWLRALIEEGKIKSENILLIGIRRKSENIDEKEFNYAQEKGIKIIFADEFDSKKDEILNFISEGHLYVSFDVDVFDSSLFSSTGYVEKNGLFEGQIFPILEEIEKNSDLKAFDLVEYNVELDNEKKDLNLIKKILKTFNLEY